MKYIKILILLLFLSPVSIKAQCPTGDMYVAPNGTGDGSSYNSPTDLQSGLDCIQPGKTLWLLDGIYNGRFHTWYSAEGNTNDPITVSSYPGEWAILNGGISCTSQQFGIFEICHSVLSVFKNYWKFKDFEITLLDNNPRDFGQERVNGISNYWGENCEFINLIIRNVTNAAISFSAGTGGSEIYGCLIYNNGINASGHGWDNAFYLHNNSENYTTIENNIVFNNYYKGISCWSAAQNNTVQYFNIINNASFNNGSPSTTRKGLSNIFVGSNGDIPNVYPNHINIIDNAVYTRDVNFSNDYGQSLEIGYKANVTDVTANNNLIIGHRWGLKLGAPKDISFTNNIVHTDYVNVWRLDDEDFILNNNWSFSNNEYYLTNSNSNKFEIKFKSSANTNDLNLNFNEWQTNYNLDTYGSSTNSHSSYNYIHKSVTQNKHKHNVFKVVISDFNSSMTTVDFSNYISVLNSMSNFAPNFQVRDVENYNSPLSIGTGNIINDNYLITFNTGLTELEQPTGGLNGQNIDDAHKTTSDFGVFLVEFSSCKFDIELTASETSNYTVQHAVNTIICAANTSTYIVDSGDTVIHKAGESIKLLPGFYAENGCYYRATIEPCITNIDYLVQQESRTDNTLYEDSNYYFDNDEVVKVYPNPSNNSITLSSEDYMVSYQLIDNLNKVYKKGDTNSRKLELNISNLKPGIYFLQITLKNSEVFTKKIIKN